jgi:8-oxo-dGTP pyrophosphatase MutT (NUDIX family)
LQSYVVSRGQAASWDPPERPTGEGVRTRRVRGSARYLGAAKTIRMFEFLRRPFEPAIRKVLHFYWRFARGLTLGVRALVIDGDGRVFLVKHSYISGWQLPGGGVEAGETLAAALARELREEGNIELGAAPIFFALYFNRRVSLRDHVALYVVHSFRQSAPPRPNNEIVAHGFFSPGALPKDTTRSTRARIAEVLDGRSIAELW